MGALKHIAGILRGQATRSQVVLACLLGGLLGFAPGIALGGSLGEGLVQAPAPALTWLALALILNTNLGLVALTAGLASLASAPLLPAAVAIGEVLLDGPTKPLLTSIANAPWLAWFGLDHYAVSGGIVLGVALGAASGWAWWRALCAIRNRMAATEESERWSAWRARRSVRLASWLMLGRAKRRDSWGEIAARRGRGVPVRWSGLAAAGALVAAGWWAQAHFGSARLRTAAAGALTQWNGATVDVAGAELDLMRGRIALRGVAMADPRRLDHDAFTADELRLDVSTSALLAGRLEIETLTALGARSGSRRAIPGERTAPPPTAPAPTDPPADDKPITAAEALELAQAVRNHLDTLADWIDRITPPATEGGEAPDAPPGDGGGADEPGPRLETPLDDLVAAHVRSAHPTWLVREMAIDGIAVPGLDCTLSVRARNLSSHPDRVAEDTELTVSGPSDRALTLAHTGPGAVTVDLALPAIEIDALRASIAGLPLHGGTASLSLRGTVRRDGQGHRVDLPLQIACRDTTLSLRGERFAIDTLPATIAVRGPIATPQLALDADALADAIAERGQARLAQELRGWANTAIDQLPVDELLRGATPPGASSTIEKALESGVENARQQLPGAIEKLWPGKR